MILGAAQKDLPQRQRYRFPAEVGVAAIQIAQPVTRADIDRSGQVLHAEELSASGQLSASIAHEVNNPCRVFF